MARWQDYDISQMGAFLTALAAWKPEQEQPMAKSRDLQTPALPIGQPQWVRLKIARNLRYGPDDSTYDVIRLMDAGSEIAVYPAVATPRGAFVWHWHGDGWIADNVGVSVFEVLTAPQPEPEPEPVQPPVVLPDDWQDAVRDMVREVVRETLAQELQTALTSIGEMVRAMTAVQYRRANAIAATAEVEAANYGLLREAQERIFGLMVPEVDVLVDKVNLDGGAK